MRPMLSSPAVRMMGLIALLTAACAPSKPPNMSDVCQMRQCVCAKDEAFWRLKEKETVQWDQEGRPFCPAGYTLRVKEQT